MRSRLLPGLAVGAGLWLVLVSAAGAVLSAVGWWTPYLAWPLAMVLVGVCGWCVRGIPEVRMPVAPAVVLVAVAAAFTVWAAATHSEQVLPRRDAASNLQAAASLASTHARLVPVDPEAVGGRDVLGLEGVTLASPAFFEVGTDADPSVEPQFVIGPAVVYGFGWWAAGAAGAFALPAVAMGFALLALGLLVTRVVGPWAGVASAAITGVLFPVLHTARATYSEPLAMVTLAAGLLAATLAAESVVPAARSAGSAGSAGRPALGDTLPAARFAGHASAQGMIVGRSPLRSLVVRDPTARAGLLAGLLVGGTGLIRVDALREVVLLLPVLALGAAFGARWVRPLLVGLAVSTVVSAVAAVGLSREYVASISDSLVPLVVLGVLVGGASWAALAAWRRGARLPASVVRRLPDAAGALVVLAGLYLASRPLWQVVRQDPDDPGARYVAGMQARQGLPVDGGRTYAEQTVAWLSWYVGPVALVVALVVLSLVARSGVASVARGWMEPWVPALVVATGSTLLTLARPGITPDHPWADRRLLVALPLVVVLVVVALDWLVGRAVSAGRRWIGFAVAGLVAASVVVPAVLATWPHRAGGVERESLAAVEQLCRALGPDDVVLAVDSRAANEWPQVVRGMCGSPSLSLTSRVRSDEELLRSTVSSVAAGVEERGGRLVLLAADSAEALVALGVTPTSVVEVTVREDEHVLERRPDRTDPLPVAVWLAPAR